MSIPSEDMKGRVHLVPNEDGSYINIYQSNPTFGYVKLQSPKVSDETEKTRTALLRAEVTMLEKFIARFGESGTVPGKIVIRDFAESKLPKSFMARLNRNISYEESVKPFLRLNEDNTYSTFSGERILRFSDYDTSITAQDILIVSDQETSKLREVQEKERSRFEELKKQVVESELKSQFPSYSSTMPDPRVMTTPYLSVSTSSKVEHISNETQNKQPVVKPQEASQNRNGQNFLFFAVLVGAISLAFVFSNIFIFLVGIAGLAFLDYLFGTMFKDLFAPDRRWSVLLIIVIGIIAIYLLVAVFGGHGPSSEPPQGWDRP